MNARGWCLLVLRVVGLVLLCYALPSLPDILFFPLYLGNYQSGLIAVQSFLSDHGLWFLVLGCYLFFGGKWVARQITRGIPVPGACPGCGYDIRNLLGTRCPECGAKVRL